MSSPVITQILPAQGSTLGGGTAIIQGSGFSATPTVYFGVIKSPNVYFVNSTEITVDIPPVKVKGTYDIKVVNPDGGTYTLSSVWTTYVPNIPNPMFPYKITLNGVDVTLQQKDRLQLTHEMAIVSSYALSYNKIDIEIPLEKENTLLLSMPDQNIFTITKNNNVVFQGYMNEKHVDECIRFVKLSSISFLNLLSKYPKLYNDTTYRKISGLLIIKFRELLSYLPISYELMPWILNSNWLNDISIGINTNGSSPNAIDTFQGLCDVFDVGIIIWNNKIFLMAIPEDLETQICKNITNFVVAPPKDINDLQGMFYNKFSLTYDTTIGVVAGTVTKGNGSIIKDLNSDNIIFKDGDSAQALVNRKYNLYSKIWVSTEVDVSREVDIKLGDYVVYNGVFNDYYFIITQITDKYTHFGCKGYGRKIKR